MSSVAGTCNDHGPAISRANSDTSWAEGVADADVESAHGSFIESIGNDDASSDIGNIDEQSFGTRLKAAVDADKAAADAQKAAIEAQKAAAEAQKAAIEAAAIARARSADLEGYTRKSSREASLSSRESLTPTALQMLQDTFIGPSSDVDYGSEAESLNLATGVKDGREVYRTNRDFDISEITCVANAMDDYSLSSISRTDSSLHLHDSQPSLGSLPGLAPTRARSIVSLNLPFPVALHTLLRDNPCPSAICWNKKGTKVKLHTKHPQFNSVLKRYFREEGSKFSNLRRKANRWKFQVKCLDKDEALYCLQNEKFSRDRDPICSEICPTKAEKTEDDKNGHCQGGVFARFPTTTAFVRENTRSVSVGTIPTLDTATTGGTSGALNLDDDLYIPAFEYKKRKVSDQTAELPPKMSNALIDWPAETNV